jgi:hypothetical protein
VLAERGELACPRQPVAGKEIARGYLGEPAPELRQVFLALFQLREGEFPRPGLFREFGEERVAALVELVVFPCAVGPELVDDHRVGAG